MKYFRVNPDFDGVNVGHHRFLIQNELYTEKEVSKYNVPKKYLSECEISEKETYFLFGARFSNDCGYSDR
jgi:hypothetical protein